jgi:protease-4
MLFPRRAIPSFVAMISLTAAALVAAAPNPALAQEKWLELSIPDGLADQSSPGLAFFGEGAMSTRELIEMIGRAKTDKHVKAMIMKAPPGGLGFAKTQEVRDSLADFRSSGKKIYTYLEAAGNSDYLLASAANEIALNPVGLVFINGLSSETMFLRGLFDKLGIVPNYEQCYEYKSAADMYVRKDMSEAHREVTNSILDDFYAQWCEAIAASRKIPVEKVRAIVDGCEPFPASAKRDGLVDHLMYQDEFDAYLEKENGGKKLEKVKTKDYRSKKGGLFNLSFDFGDKPKIAIV